MFNMKTLEPSDNWQKEDKTRSIDFQIKTKLSDVFKPILISDVMK